MPEQAADLRLLEERAGPQGGLAELAADMDRERQHDEEADQARVDDRERPEVQDPGAVEALLPEEQERPRDEVGPVDDELRVGGCRGGKAEPGHRDRR